MHIATGGRREAPNRLRRRHAAVSTAGTGARAWTTARGFYRLARMSTGTRRLAALFLLFPACNNDTQEPTVGLSTASMITTVGETQTTTSSTSGEPTTSAEPTTDATTGSSTEAPEET